MGLWPDTLGGPAVVTWDGVRWRRHQDDYYRYSKRGLLHRFVYERAHGPIPGGWHVHHIDHNPLNNDPANLVAKSPADHWAEHRDERGADWHSLGGRAAWADRQPVDATCKQCGQIFTSRATFRAGLCSDLCRERWYRANKRGRTYEPHVCVVCGTGFQRVVRIKPPPSATCSRPCTALYIADRKRAYPRFDGPG